MIFITRFGVLLEKCLVSPLDQLMGEDWDLLFFSLITTMWDLGVWFSHETCCTETAASTGRLESSLKYFTHFPVLVWLFHQARLRMPGTWTVSTVMTAASSANRVSRSPFPQFTYLFLLCCPSRSNCGVTLSQLSVPLQARALAAAAALNSAVFDKPGHWMEHFIMNIIEKRCLMCTYFRV